MVSHMTVIPLQNCCSITYHSLYAVCCIPWLTYQLTGDSCLFTPLTCLPSPPSPPRPSRLATTHLPSRASQVAAVAKDPPARAGDVRDASLILGLGRSPGGGHGNHSGILAWRIPWTEEPGGEQSMGSQRVGRAWSDLACTHLLSVSLNLLEFSLDGNCISENSLISSVSVRVTGAYCL